MRLIRRVEAKMKKALRRKNVTVEEAADEFLVENPELAKDEEDLEEAAVPLSEDEGEVSRKAELKKKMLYRWYRR